MTTPTKARPIDHVQPPLTGAGVERMWRSIEARTGSRRTARALRWGALALAGVALAVGVVLLVQPEAQTARAGDLVVTRAEPTRLRLPDDSEVQVSESSGLRIVRAADDEVRVRLSRGKAHFAVSKRPARRFEVKAGPLAVVVRGTRFDVTVEGPKEQPERITVEVQEGRVEVQDADGGRLALLGAGQSFSHRSDPQRAVTRAAPEPNLATPEPPPTAPSEAESAETVPVEPVLRRAAPHAATRSDDSARALFEQANRARLSGDLVSVARSLESLLRRHPRDARAGLAAFELARIRFDSLHDPQGALTALRIALRRAGGGVAREDALALQIRALAQLGRIDACQKARDRFLKQHPHSAHVPRMRELCQP